MLSARDRETIDTTGYEPGTWQIETPDIPSCDLLTVQQAAAVTGITEDTIHAWIRRGHMRAIRPSSGGLYLDEFEFVECAEKMIGYRSRVTRQLNMRHHDDVEVPLTTAGPDARMVTASEACGLLGVPNSTIRSWALRGKLVSHAKRGSLPLYDIDDICELASHQPPGALIRKAQAAVSFAIDALETDVEIYGDTLTVLTSLRTAQDALTIVITGRSA